MKFSIQASFKLDDGAVRKLSTGRGQPVWNAAVRAGGVVRDRAKLELTRKGLGDTGRLRNSIESSTSARGNQVVSTVGTDVNYARFVHDGTSGPIVPRRARMLRFRPKGSSVFVFAKQVRGTRETGRFTPYLEDALKSLKTQDFS